MKTILKRNKLTNEIICDAGEYEILKSRGTTDEAIMEMLTKFNKTKPDVYAEIVELNDIAEFYYKKKDTVYSECTHTELEKKLTSRLNNIQIDRQEERCDYNLMKKYEAENVRLSRQNEELKEELSETKNLLNKREHNVADFAIANSRYVNDKQYGKEEIWE